jgi:hypothetical protein
MTLTILALAGTFAALAAVYAVITKAEPAQALAGETTISDAVAAAETLAGGREVPPLGRTDWKLTTVTALCDAEELLDVLEMKGFTERELVVMGNSCFAVRWR